MNAEFKVEVLKETDYPAWSMLVGESPDGRPYSTAEYLDALCGAGAVRGM